MSDKTARSAGRLADVMKQAAKAAQPVTGAVLGTVVQVSPTLDVQLDTGQLIPQCAGHASAVGARVLCHWIEDGHNVAIQPMADGSAYAATIFKSYAT